MLEAARVFIEVVKVLIEVVKVLVEAVNCEALRVLAEQCFGSGFSEFSGSVSGFVIRIQGAQQLPTIMEVLMFSFED